MFIELEPDIVNKYNPIVAKDTPKMAFRFGLFLKMNKENIGTNTTLRPVIRPAFEDVVYCNPNV